MLGPRAGFVDAHEALWDEVQRGGEVCGVVVRGPHVHEEGSAGWDHGGVVDDGFGGLAGERHVEGGPVAEDFFDEGGHVFAGFVGEAAVPGVGVGVGGHDFGEGFGLDGLPVGGGQVGDCHCISKSAKYMNSFSWIRAGGY